MIHRRLILAVFAIQTIILFGQGPAAYADVNACAQIYLRKEASSSAGESFQSLSKAEKYQVRKNFLYSRLSSKEVLRVPHAKTSGLRSDAADNMDPADIRIDTADPSLVMPIYYPNGVTKYRINFSGMRFIEADTIAELFMTGVQKVKRSRGFYKDGTEMVGAYHNEAWPWDVVIYRNDQGELIALGGVMEQAVAGQLPNVATHNQSRSRWWGKVVHKPIKGREGEFEEHIIWQEPVHDFNRSKHQGWEYHGYGGTLVTAFNPKSGLHEPIKTENGNYILMYERVTEEKNGMPWVTTTFMREMDPSLKSTVGPEIKVTNIISPTTGKIFEAFRRGGEHETTGFLREGDNVLKVLQYNQFIKAGSGNDYVRKYGIYLDYRDPGDGPMGMYKNVVDKNGELIDFADVLGLREMFNAIWVGRPQFNYDHQGKLWLSFHFVPKDSLPPGAPHSDWPPAHIFPLYGRLTAMVPVRIVHDKNGQPTLVLDIDARYRHLYEDYIGPAAKLCQPQDVKCRMAQ